MTSSVTTPPALRRTWACPPFQAEDLEEIDPGVQHVTMARRIRGGWGPEGSDPRCPSDESSMTIHGREDSTTGGCSRTAAAVLCREWNYSSFFSPGSSTACGKTTEAAGERLLRHLHLHTEFSMLDGAARIGDVMAAAAADGQPPSASRPREHVRGPRFLRRGQKAGITPIIGMEGYFVAGRATTGPAGPTTRSST